MFVQAFFCYPVVWLFSEGFASFSVSFEVGLLCTFASKSYDDSNIVCCGQIHLYTDILVRLTLPKFRAQLVKCNNSTILCALVTDLRIHHPRCRDQGARIFHGHERPRRPPRGPRREQGFLLNARRHVECLSTRVSDSSHYDMYEFGRECAA